jgi:hypothetical protein
MHSTNFSSQARSCSRQRRCARVQDNAQLLVTTPERFQVLDVPVVVTEQNPRGKSEPPRGTRTIVGESQRNAF